MVKIERRMMMRAPRARVWSALTDVAEFGKWFRVDAKGRFAPGEVVEMICRVEGYDGLRFCVQIEEMTPEKRFSWLWHPGSAMPTPEQKEPMTRVVFELEEVEGGTMVTVEESGFDALSAERRAKAYQENEAGWREQMNALAKYVGEAG